MPLSLSSEHTYDLASANGIERTHLWLGHASGEWVLSLLRFTPWGLKDFVVGQAICWVFAAAAWGHCSTGRATRSQPVSGRCRICPPWVCWCKKPIVCASATCNSSAAPSLPETPLSTAIVSATLILMWRSCSAKRNRCKNVLLLWPRFSLKPAAASRLACCFSISEAFTSACGWSKTTLSSSNFSSTVACLSYCVSSL